MPKIYDNLLIIGGDTEYPLIVYTQSNGNPTLSIREDGNVAIGMSPSFYRFEVSGTTSTTGFRMTTGASAGYIFKSDTSGNATWEVSEFESMPDVDDKTIEISIDNEVRLKQTVGVAYDSGNNVVARHFNGAIEYGYNTYTTGTSSFAGGYGSTASGELSFIHSYNSIVSGNRSVILGGQNINGTANDTVYVPNFNISLNLTTVSTTDNLLVRDSDGSIKSISPSLLFTTVNGMTGSGTTNYISKFISTSSIGDSSIYDNGTGVGIGTTSPSAKLEINAGSSNGLVSNTTTGYAITAKSTGTGVALLARSEASGSLPFTCQTDSSTHLLTVFYDGKISMGAGATPTSKLHIKGLGSSDSTFSLKIDNSSSNTSLYVRDDGNVGISVSNPERRLQIGINNNTTFKGSDINSISIGSDMSNTAGSNLKLLILDNSYYDGGIVYQYSGFGVSSGSMDYVGWSDVVKHKFYVYGNTQYFASLSKSGMEFYAGMYIKSVAGDSYTLRLEDENANKIFNVSNTTGNVGIGVESPSNKLEVNGKTKTTNLQINTGSVASGYVLTSSDSSGNTSWKSVGTASGIGSVNKYSTTILNTNITINTPITLTHNLVTTDIVITAWDISLNEMTFAKFSNRTTNGVDVTFTSKPSGDIKIVIMA
jgi:hypothetical protein